MSAIDGVPFCIPNQSISMNLSDEELIDMADPSLDAKRARDKWNDEWGWIWILLGFILLFLWIDGSVRESYNNASSEEQEIMREEFKIYEDERY